MIVVDGSMGEGGGQVVRMAVALSALTGKDCRIGSIRGGRPKPGLSAQHLTAVRGVAGFCNAEVEGDLLGSTELVFRPGELRCRRTRLDVGTAGSVTLVLQACLLPAIGSGQEVEIAIHGGTNVRWSPPIDYFSGVLFPLMERMGARLHMETRSRGFFPSGGGEVTLRASCPKGLRPLRLDARGKFRGMEGICFTRNLPDHVCKRISQSARRALMDLGEIKMRGDRGEGVSTGAGVLLIASYDNSILGADSLGERAVPAERVGMEAAGKLEAEMRSMGTLDIHAADQLLPYMALTPGRSCFLVREVSEHLVTLTQLLPLFLDVSIVIREIERGYEIGVEPSHT